MKDTLFKNGYRLFSPTHLAVMGICAASGTAMVRKFRKMNDAQRQKVLKMTASIPLTLETIQDTVLSFRHQMNAQYLPFNLCGHAMFVEAFHSHMPKGKSRKELGNMIYTLFLPGAAMALVFPGWNNLPLFFPVSAKKYAAHFFLVIYGILLHQNGEIQINKRTMPEDLAWLYGSALLLWKFNEKHNTNYLYTHEPVDPLRNFWNRYGKSSYIALMMFAGLFLVSVMIGADISYDKVQNRK